MNKDDLIYQNDCISIFLCDDILELCNENEYIIPKNNNEWKMIETLLYKEILFNLTQYKKNLINLNSILSNDLIEKLSKKIYTPHFKLTKHKILNRFNVLSYFVCLYDTLNINNKIYNNVKGKIFLFPEEYKVDTFGFYGQLCYENVV